MNTYETTQTEVLNATDFLGSNYLKKEDLEGETRVTLIAVQADEMPNSTRRKLVARFQEYEKGLILNATNIKRLCHIFQTRNAAQWRGAITLYVDDNIEYAGTRVGGIRVKEAAPNGGGTQPNDALPF